MTQPTPEEPQGPPMSGPLPTGPAYPGPPPPGYPLLPPGQPDRDGLAFPPGQPDRDGLAVPPGLIEWAAYVDTPAKSRLTAGMLGIFLGAFGVHRFYLGFTSIGVLQILVTIATCGVGGLWGIIEGGLILGGSGIKTDADGRPLRP